MSTPDRGRTLAGMDTETAHVTCAQAAALAGVSMRTIRRWRAAGLLNVTRPDGPWGTAMYDLNQVRKAAKMQDLALPPETDISG